MIFQSVFKVGSEEEREKEDFLATFRRLNNRLKVGGVNTVTSFTDGSGTGCHDQSSILQI